MENSENKISFSSTDNESPEKHLKALWFFRTSRGSELWDIPFDCQVIEAFYWRWFFKGLFTCCIKNCAKKFEAVSLK